MNDWDEDSFAHDDHILPESVEEWEEENRFVELTPDEADEFFMQEDVDEQIDEIIKGARGAIAFDEEGARRVREYFRAQGSASSSQSFTKLNVERLEDRQGGDPSNQGEVLE